MSTVYPSDFDDFILPGSKLDAPSHTSMHKQKAAALRALEEVVGKNPSGSYASVKDRLTAIEGSIPSIPSDIGAIPEPQNDGTSGQALVTDGSGGRSWATISGGGAPTPDATTSVKGKIKLSGDLGGTADSPTVPGLASKVDTSDPRLSDARTPTAHSHAFADLSDVDFTGLSDGDIPQWDDNAGEWVPVPLPEGGGGGGGDPAWTGSGWMYNPAHGCILPTHPYIGTQSTTPGSVRWTGTPLTLAPGTTLDALHVNVTLEHTSDWHFAVYSSKPSADGGQEPDEPIAYLGTVDPGATGIKSLTGLDYTVTDPVEWIVMRNGGGRFTIPTGQSALTPVAAFDTWQIGRYSTTNPSIPTGPGDLPSGVAWVSGSAPLIFVEVAS